VVTGVFEKPSLLSLLSLAVVHPEAAGRVSDIGQRVEPALGARALAAEPGGPKYAPALFGREFGVAAKQEGQL